MDTVLLNSIASLDNYDNKDVFANAPATSGSKTVVATTPIFFEEEAANLLADLRDILQQRGTPAKPR
jgi:hypothetical protein